MKNTRLKFHNPTTFDGGSSNQASRKTTFGIHALLRRTPLLLIGCSGLIWGISNLVSSAASDSFRDIESSLLKFETFNRQAALAILDSKAARKAQACDTHAQRALMLLEVPLADASLRSGKAQDFDRHTLSLEQRANRTLSCAPRDSLVWLLLFGLRNEHGLLDTKAFDLLAMSYATSPNEAWVAVRRIVVAIPVILAAPMGLREKILVEFQALVRRGFVGPPALAYINASAEVRALLQARLDELDPDTRDAFKRAVEKQNS
jgi:hypothetical protein